MSSDSYITDIDQFTVILEQEYAIPNMNYYYYGNREGITNIYAYMSSSDLTEYPEGSNKKMEITLFLTAEDSLKVENITNQIIYKNAEDIEITYNFGKFLRLCVQLYVEYCKNIQSKIFKDMLENYFGIFMQYIFYNRIDLLTPQSWLDSGEQRKVGLLRENCSDFFEITNDILSYPYQLPLQGNAGRFKCTLAFSSYNVKNTDIVENIIKNGHKTLLTGEGNLSDTQVPLTYQEQILILNSFQLIFNMNNYNVLYAPFWVDNLNNLPDEYKWHAFYIQYANDVGESVISMLQEAIDKGNTEEEPLVIGKYLDNDHLWICKYEKDQGDYIYPNADIDRTRIRKCKPYLKLKMINPIYVEFPDDTSYKYNEYNNKVYYIIWNDINEEVLSSKNSYTIWVNKQIDRIKRISESIFEFTNFALVIRNGIYWVDSFDATRLLLIYEYYKAINKWWSVCPFNEENMRTICSLYGIEYADLNETIVKQITGNLCEVINGEFRITGYSITQSLFNKFQSNIYGLSITQNIRVYPSLSTEYLTDFSENQARSRRAQWLPFSRTNQSELEPSLLDTPGCIYAELLNSLRSPIYPVCISDIKQYTIDQKYIYSDSNTGSKTLLMSEVLLTEDDYSGIGNCTRYDIQDE